MYIGWQRRKIIKQNIGVRIASMNTIGMRKTIKEIFFSVSARSMNLVDS